MTVAEYSQRHPGWLSSATAGILNVKDDEGNVQLLCPADVLFASKEVQDKVANWEVIEK